MSSMINQIAPKRCTGNWVHHTAPNPPSWNPYCGQPTAGAPHMGTPILRRACSAQFEEEEAFPMDCPLGIRLGLPSSVARARGRTLRFGCPDRIRGVGMPQGA